MKIENILKSAMIIGLLAGAADMNPALGKDVKRLGKDIHCPDITVTNTSASDAYEVQVLYHPCGHKDHQESIRVKSGETGKIKDGIDPESEVRIDKIIPNSSRTPNLWNQTEVSANMKINCIGSFGDPDCSPEVQPSPSKQSTKK